MDLLIGMLVTSALVAVPVGVAVVAGVATRRLRRRTANAWLPVPAVACAVLALAGWGVAASAPSGLEGLGHGLLGAYLLATGVLGACTAVLAALLPRRADAGERFSPSG